MIYRTQTMAAPFYQICIPLRVGTAGVPCNPDARDWTGKTRSLLGGLTMQDQIIPCKHDFILRLRLDMQMSYIFRLMDETASNMMLTSLARGNV